MTAPGSPYSQLNYQTPSQQLRPPRRFGGIIGWVVFIGLALLFYFLLQTKRSNPTLISLSDFRNQVAAHNLISIEMSGDEIDGVLKNSTLLSANGGQTPGATLVRRFQTQLPAGMGTDWRFVQWMMEADPSVQVTINKNGTLIENLVIPLIPWILIFFFIWFFVFRQLKKARATQAPGAWPVAYPGMPGYPPPQPPNPPYGS